MPAHDCTARSQPVGDENSTSESWVRAHITSTGVASNPKEVAPLFEAKSHSSELGISDPLCLEPEASVQENSLTTNA